MKAFVKVKKLQNSAMAANNGCNSMLLVYVDVNECNDIFGNPCHNGRCENTNGSYKCFCPPGYIFDSNKKLCVG